MSQTFKLHTYFRSSAAYRVRIALNLKGLPFGSVPVDLVKGDQSSAGFRTLNPQGLVPVLEVNERVVSQSLAIIEYLDEMHPEPALLPADPWRRAQCRSLAYAIACDTHPLNNLRVLNFLRDDLRVDQPGRDAWYAHWVRQTLAGLEASVAADGFCSGSNPTLADVCLVPQMFNARRFNIDLTDFPRLVAIDAAMAAIPEVAAAHPARQPDARPE